MIIAITDKDENILEILPNATASQVTAYASAQEIAVDIDGKKVGRWVMYSKYDHYEDTLRVVTGEGDHAP